MSTKDKDGDGLSEMGLRSILLDVFIQCHPQPLPEQDDLRGDQSKGKARLEFVLHEHKS